MMGCFVEGCRRRIVKVNANKIKMMVLGREEGLECEIRVNGSRMEHVSRCKYLGVFWMN